MPPRKKIVPTDFPRMKELQDALTRAHGELEIAKSISDELGEEFTFLDRTYVPKKTVVQGGDWEDQLDSSWNSSVC